MKVTAAAAGALWADTGSPGTTVTTITADAARIVKALIASLTFYFTFFSLLLFTFHLHNPFSFERTVIVVVGDDHLGAAHVDALADERNEPAHLAAKLPVTRKRPSPSVRMARRPPSATRFFAHAIRSGEPTVAAPCWRKQLTSTTVPRIVAGGIRLMTEPWPRVGLRGAQIPQGSPASSLVSDTCAYTPPVLRCQEFC